MRLDALLIRPMSSPPRLDQTVDIETPEQVVFSYTIAGIGSRAAAAIIDYFIMIAALVALGILLPMIMRVVLGSAHPLARASGAWVAALVILFAFVVQWGYFVLFEALWDGQTPGKRKLGIRVVQDGGYSISFAASTVRNLIRVIDMQPIICYGVGITSATFSKSGKRLGDIVAGTFVVRERLVSVAPAALPAEASAPEAATLMAALTVDEYELLDRFVARRAELDAERRTAIAAQLAERFRAHLPDDDRPPLARLLELHRSEAAARARGAAPRGATGAGREQHAIIAGAAARWSAFAAMLSDARRRGLRTMSDREVGELVARYRETATDLARLRTASRGRDTDALFYVSRLVSVGHNLLYRRRTLPLRTAGRFLFVSVPRELRRSAFYILGAAVLLFAPVAITYRVVITDPPLAERLLPPGMIDRVNEGAVRAQQGDSTYIPVKSFERPVMASRIIANNVQVTYAVFALGITAGIMTALTLILNGVSIGAALALYATRGIFFQIGTFVLPHSVFELSAICIAGGGGLLIASALLLPGALTRREALIVKGRRAIRLIAASTLLLVFAGLIEGLISPRTDIPLGVKYAVAAVCAVALLAYLSLGWWGGAEAPAEEFAYSDARALSSR
jgi:uncharacterized membrane protein SpoIIM required for sporulation/uncharacterized RDD family membrane protein YckC